MNPNVVTLAKRYGVKVQPLECLRTPETGTRGPRGHGCDPASRTVFLESSKWDVEVQLHELAHVIVQPPWWPMVDVPEELLLMQFERSLARVALDNKSLRRTIAWQHETEVSVFCSMLEELEGYERSGFWRLGFRLCRMLGILDARRRPTWRWPDWQKLEPYKASLERYIDERGQTPPLVKNAVA